jgi:hypothetical protein
VGQNVHPQWSNGARDPWTYELSVQFHAKK